MTKKVLWQSPWYTHGIWLDVRLVRHSKHMLNMSWLFGHDKLCNCNCNTNTSQNPVNNLYTLKYTLIKCLYIMGWLDDMWVEDWRWYERHMIFFFSWSLYIYKNLLLNRKLKYNYPFIFLNSLFSSERFDFLVLFHTVSRTFQWAWW